MQITPLETAADRDAWDAFVATHPAATHYHRAGWQRIIERTYRNPTVYLMARDRGEVAGLLPLALVSGFPSATHLVSLPYLGYAGLCARAPEAAEALLAEAERQRARFGARYVELHNLAPHAGEAAPLTTNTDKLRMVLALESDPERLWKRLDAKVRNQVRKATKSGLRIEVGGAEFIEPFYAAFAENMRDLGSPVHRIGLFRELFSAFPDDTRLFMVFKDEVAVGGAVLVRHKGLAEVPWASSRREFFSMCPNNLLYWEILRDCCTRGIAEFDFGRSTRASGTFRFKEQWGAEPRPLYWQFQLPADVPAPDPTHTSLKARLMVRMWQKLPLQVANRLGPLVRGRISA